MQTLGSRHATGEVNRRRLSFLPFGNSCRFGPPYRKAVMENESNANASPANDRDAIIRRLGEKALSELIRPSITPEEQPHPEEDEITRWLAIECVKGKFDRWWHQRVSSAQNWRIDVPPTLSALAAIFDRLFPGTSNTFNIFSELPPVTESVLVDYLFRVHEISQSTAENLSLIELLYILRKDLQSKENTSARQETVDKTESTVSGPVEPKTKAEHSEDFRSVNWFGTNYSFSANQAACVKFLWEHWERGVAEVGGKTILESADIGSDRIDNVFRFNPAWKTMIRPGRTKGTYRLAEPKAAPLNAATPKAKNTKRARK
jgi:hypothetical protein